jgi:branched-chain amino acid transport system substrate-binding protein
MDRMVPSGEKGSRMIVSGDSRRWRRVVVMLIAASLAVAGALALPVGAAVAAGTSPPKGKATGTPIKIGLIANEGGTAISLPEVTQAAVAAAKYANANLKGMGNHVISLDICKEQEDDASARACANQMVEDKVSAVVIGITAAGAAMAPTITQAGIPYVSINGTAAEEFLGSPVFFWTAGLPGLLGGAATEAKSEGLKKVVAVASDTGTLVSGLKAIGTPFFQSAGIDFDVVGIPTGTADASAQITTALSGNPGAIFVVSDVTTCIAAIKGMKTVGAKAALWTIPTCSADAVQKAVPGALNKATIFTNADPTSNDPEARLYRKVMKKYAPKVDPNSDATYGYQGMMSLVYANAALGDDTSAAGVTATIKAAQNVTLPAGHGVTFTCGGSAYPGNPIFKNFCANQELVTVLKGNPATQTTYKLVGPPT